MDESVIKNVQHLIHTEADYVLPHTHGFYELIYYVSGSGRSSIISEHYKYQEDTLAIIEPGMNHDESASKVSEVICCQFEDELEFGFNTRLISKNKSNEEILKEIKEKMLSIVEQYKQKPRNEKKLNKLGFELSLSLFRLINNEEHNKNVAIENVVNAVKKYINKNYTKNINYQILSESLGYSYDLLRHIFVDYEKIGMDKYKYNLRLVRAKRYLEESGEQIASVAKKCGFSNSARFCLWFKKEMNISPLQYRKMLGKSWNWNVFNLLKDGKNK